jgi:hypothetical protein
MGSLWSPGMGPGRILPRTFDVLGDVQDSFSEQYGTSLGHQHGENDGKPISDSDSRECDLSTVRQ